MIIPLNSPFLIPSSLWMSLSVDIRPLYLDESFNTWVYILNLAIQRGLVIVPAIAPAMKPLTEFNAYFYLLLILSS